MNLPTHGISKQSNTNEKTLSKLTKPHQNKQMRPPVSSKKQKTEKYQDKKCIHWQLKTLMEQILKNIIHYSFGNQCSEWLCNYKQKEKGNHLKVATS